MVSIIIRSAAASSKDNRFPVGLLVQADSRTDSIQTFISQKLGRIFCWNLYSLGRINALIVSVVKMICISTECSI